jgi:ribonucleoside-diphosphate reductase alpha chain
VFLTVAKAGSTLQGLMDSFATLLSLTLQYGIPLAVIAKKFRHVRFEPNGFTGGKQIPSASSLIDYVFAFLEHEFLKGETKAA